MHPMTLDLHSDTGCQVAKYLDIRSITHFSEVNRATYANRNKWFLELFKRLHPEIVAYAQSQQDPDFCFSELVQYHPNNCWKIACYALSKGIFKANDAFVKEAIPFLPRGELSIVLKTHTLALKSEFMVVFVRHKMLPPIAECARLMDGISNGTRNTSPENYDRIRNLINSGGTVCQDRIWGNLQYSRGWGVQEENWAENHFHEGSNFPTTHLLVKQLFDGLEKIQKENIPQWLLCE